MAQQRRFAPIGKHSGWDEEGFAHSELCLYKLDRSSRQLVELTRVQDRRGLLQQPRALPSLRLRCCKVVRLAPCPSRSSRSAFAQSFTLGGGDDMFQISCMGTRRMTTAITSKAANMFVTNQFTSPRVHQHTTSARGEGWGRQMGSKKFNG